MSIRNFAKIPKIAFIEAYDNSKYAKNAIREFVNTVFMIFVTFSDVLRITTLKVPVHSRSYKLSILKIVSNCGYILVYPNHLLCILVRFGT